MEGREEWSEGGKGGKKLEKRKRRNKELVSNRNR